MSHLLYSSPIQNHNIQLLTLKSIRTKLVIGTLLPSLIALALILGVVSYWQQATIRDKGRSEIIRKTSQLTERFDAQLREVLSATEAAARFASSLGNVDESEILLFLERHVRESPLLSSAGYHYHRTRVRADLSVAFTPGVDGVVLFVHRNPTDSTEIIHSDYRFSELPASWAEVYQRVEESGQPLWSVPYFDSLAAGVNMLTFAVPVLQADGENSGVFSVDVGYPQLYKYFQERKQLVLEDDVAKFSTYIIDDDGRFVHHESEELFGVYVEPRLRSLNANGLADWVSKIVSEKQDSGTFTYTDENNTFDESVPRWMLDSKVQEFAWKRMRGLDATVIVGASRSTISPFSYSTLLWQIGIALAMMVMIGAVMWESIGNVFKPLSRLRSSAIQIGSGETPESLPEDQDDEIGEVARAMGNMVKQLKDREEEIQYVRQLGFAELIDNLPGEAFFFSADHNGKITFVSPGIERILGFKQDDFLYWNVALTDEGNVVYDKEVEAILSGKSPESAFAVDAVHFSGKIRNLDVFVRPTLDDLNRIHGIEGLGVDITERMSEVHKFKTYLDGAPDAMFIIAVSGQITMVNHQAIKLSGYTEQELLNMNVDDLVPFNARDGHRTYRHMFLSNPVRRNLDNSLDLRILTKSGKSISVDIALGPVKTEQGRFVCATLRDLSEFKKAHKAVEETQRLLQGVIDTTDSLVYVVDTKGRFQLVNDALAEASQVPRENWLGKTFVDLLDAEIAVPAVEMDASVMKSGQRCSLEETYMRMGEKRFYQTVKFPLIDTQGKVTGMCSMSADITEIKQVQLELEGAQATLNEEKIIRDLALEAGGIGVWGSDLRTGEHTWDERMRPIMGYQPDVPASRSQWEKALHPEERQAVLAKMEESFRNKQDLDLEYRIYHQISGEVRYNRSRAKVIYDESGMPTSVVGVVMDVTASRVQAQKIAQLFNAPTDGVAFLVDGEIVEANVALATMIGVTSADELPGKQFKDISADFQAGDTPLDQAVAALMEKVSQNDVVETSWLIKKTDGSKLPVMMTLFKAEHDGRPARLCTLKDVTELQAAIDLANERAATIGRMSREQETFVRHEMSNAVGPLMGQADMLHRNPDMAPDQRKKWIDRIQRSVISLKDLLDAMRDLQAIERGAKPIRREPLDLLLMLSDEIRQQELTLGRKGGISFSANLDNPIFYADPGFLPGVFRNLLKNAVEHVKDLPAKEQNLSIAVGETEGGVGFLVVNGGPPVPEHRLEHFFEKFNSTKKTTGGTGLGTSYAAIVVRAHGGTIAVRSTLEQGTRIRVWLPRVEAEEPAEA